MESKNFLHELIKRTNVERPYGPGMPVGYMQYPTQSEKVGTSDFFYYYNQNYVPMIDDDSREKEYVDMHDRVFRDSFLTLREDITGDATDKSVYISSDYNKMFVHQKDKITTNLVTPSYLEYLVGLRVYPEYEKDLVAETRECYILDIQALEPGFCVIVEYFDDETYRIILDTELYFTYNPDDIYIPVEKRDLGEIRRQLLEGRVPYAS